MEVLLFDNFADELLTTLRAYVYDVKHGPITLDAFRSTVRGDSFHCSSLSITHFPSTTWAGARPITLCDSMIALNALKDPLVWKQMGLPVHISLLGVRVVKHYHRRLMDAPFIYSNRFLTNYNYVLRAVLNTPRIVSTRLLPVTSFYPIEYLRKLRKFQSPITYASNYRLILPWEGSKIGYKYFRVGHNEISKSELFPQAVQFR